LIKRVLPPGLSKVSPKNAGQVFEPSVERLSTSVNIQKLIYFEVLKQPLLYLSIHQGYPNKSDTKNENLAHVHKIENKMGASGDLIP
tara:strand:+ start:82 stop:342 length:261 start_codon:yes stop_codon:yes gene_type:complete